MFAAIYIAIAILSCFFIPCWLLKNKADEMNNSKSTAMLIGVFLSILWPLAFILMAVQRKKEV